MEIEVSGPVIYWVCPYCGEEVQWPTEARGHLIGQHNPSDTSATDTIRSLIIPDIGDEEDKEGRRFWYRCPFCEVSADNFASFATAADLNTHLTDTHGCS